MEREVYQNVFKLMCEFNQVIIQPTKVYLGNQKHRIVNNSDDVEKYEWEQYCNSMHNGHPNGIAIGLTHLYSDRYALPCSRYMCKHLVEKMTEHRIERDGDLLTAIYIPEHVNCFQWSIKMYGDELDFGFVYKNEKADDETLVELLAEEKAAYRTSNNQEFYLSIELEQHHKHVGREWTTRGEENIEIDGEVYKRV